VLQPEPIGSYLYQKYGGTYHVTVFVMQVTEVAQEWPERELRQRSWLGQTSALERIEDPGLCDLLQAVFAKTARDRVRAEM
jgi:hypothetical protein